MISIIAAIDDKRGIGKNNDLLFKIPEDGRRLREITTGHPLVMGRKTFESLHRPSGLPNRTNIIVSRNPLKFTFEENDEKFGVVNSLEEGIDFAKRSPGSDEIFIFGGGQIFKEAIEKGLVDRLYLTIVEGDYDADKFFPEYPEFTKVIEEVDKEANGYRYKFLTLEK